MTSNRPVSGERTLSPEAEAISERKKALHHALMALALEVPTPVAHDIANHAWEYADALTARIAHLESEVSRLSKDNERMDELERLLKAGTLGITRSTQHDYLVFLLPPTVGYFPTFREAADSSLSSTPQGAPNV